MESPWALLQQSATKMENLQTSEYLLQNLVIKQKICKLQQIIYFLKALGPANSNVQQHLQNFYNLNVYSRKIENVQIAFKGICAKSVQNIFAKIAQSVCFSYRLSKEL